MAKVLLTSAQLDELRNRRQIAPGGRYTGINGQFRVPRHNIRTMGFGIPTNHICDPVYVAAAHFAYIPENANAKCWWVVPGRDHCSNDPADRKAATGVWLDASMLQIPFVPCEGSKDFEVFGDAARVLLNAGLLNGMEIEVGPRVHGGNGIPTMLANRRAAAEVLRTPVQGLPGAVQLRNSSMLLDPADIVCIRLPLGIKSIPTTFVLARLIPLPPRSHSMEVVRLIEDNCTRTLAVEVVAQAKLQREVFDKMSSQEWAAPGLVPNAKPIMDPPANDVTIANRQQSLKQPTEDERFLAELLCGELPVDTVFNATYDDPIDKDLRVAMYGRRISVQHTYVGGVRSVHLLHENHGVRGVRGISKHELLTYQFDQMFGLIDEKRIADGAVVFVTTQRGKLGKPYTFDAASGLLFDFTTDGRVSKPLASTLYVTSQHLFRVYAADVKQVGDVAILADMETRRAAQKKANLASAYGAGERVLNQLQGYAPNIQQRPAAMPQPFAATLDKVVTVDDALRSVRNRLLESVQTSDSIENIRAMVRAITYIEDARAEVTYAHDVSDSPL
jgi:hypothetical protein